MANTTGRKYGGRKKGTPNKLTREIRIVLKDLLHDELSELPSRLDSLEIKDRIDIMIKLLPYALPKVKNVNPNAGEPMSFDIEVY